MGETLDILSRFTAHSSNCLFTSGYVQCVCVLVIYIYIYAFLCVFASAYSVRHVLYVHDHVSTVYVCTCVCMCLLVGCLMPHQLSVLDLRRLFAFLSD